MNTSEEIKNMVKVQYSKIALQTKVQNETSCCGATAACCSEGVYSIMADEYKGINGYNEEADLGLGCGLPTQFAKIKKGDIVIDLGSGAGNDCFIARAETGHSGKVIGIDITAAMVNRARRNAENLQFNNVEFRHGDVENLPVSNDTANVVISNCVLNLVPDKEKVFAEILRVLKAGGHFSISDVVISGDLPEKLLQAAEMYAGCIAGAIQKDEYLNIIKSLGFENINIQKEKVITIPDSILLSYLSEDEVKSFKTHQAAIYSITIYAEKKKEDCCDKETCCK